MTTSHKDLTAHGYKWAYDAGGAHFYTQRTLGGFHLIRLLPSDITLDNFEFMAANGLSNTNPMPLITKDKRYALAKEWIGCAKPHWVARFCGQWVGASPSRKGANELAWESEQRRCGNVTLAG